MLPRAKVGAENHHSGWHLSAVHWGGQGGGKPGHLQVLCAYLFVPVCVCVGGLRMSRTYRWAAVLIASFG